MANAKKDPTSVYMTAIARYEDRPEMEIKKIVFGMIQYVVQKYLGKAIDFSIQAYDAGIEGLCAEFPNAGYENWKQRGKFYDEAKNTIITRANELNEAASRMKE